jgi:hypothetical protein
MTYIKKFVLASGLTSVLLLSACGSDDDDIAPVTGGVGGGGSVSDSVPASASASSAAFIDFLLTLGDDESSEPLLIADGFAVPEDEANDARQLN